MKPALAGLDDIDWASLRHAYGAAADVPDLIRALRSMDDKTRRDAVWALFGNIFHQGTRYEATAYAIPFLLELLAADDTRERHEIINLLVAMAIGFDEMYLPEPMPIAALRTSVETANTDGGAEDAMRRFELAAYDAVRVGVPLFRELMSHPDDELRRWAAYALAWFPEDAPTTLPFLERAYSDPNPDVAATAIVATGLLGGDPGPSVSDEPVIRWATAIAAANVRRAAIDSASAHELLKWSAGTFERSSTIPYLEGDLAGYASLALRQLGDRYDGIAFETLLARIPTVSGTEALPVVEAALRTAFPAGRTNKTPYRQLTDNQRRLVDALADSPETWRMGGMVFANFSLLMRGFGLPADCDSLNSFRAEAH